MTTDIKEAKAEKLAIDKIANKFMLDFADQLGEKYIFFKAQDAIELLSIATLEQKIEIIMISLTAAVGGKSLCIKEQMFPRKCAIAKLPHISFNNQTNYYLLSAIGNVLLEYLEPLGSELAKNYKAALGNTFLYDNSVYKRSRFSFAKKNLIRNIKSMYNFTYSQKVEIIDLCTKGLDKINELKQKEYKLVNESFKPIYKSFLEIESDITSNDPNKLVEFKINKGIDKEEAKRMRYEVLNIVVNKTDEEKARDEYYAYKIEEVRDRELEMKIVKDLLDKERKNEEKKKADEEKRKKEEEEEKFRKEAKEQAEIITMIRQKEKRDRAKIKIKEIKDKEKSYKAEFSRISKVLNIIDPNMIKAFVTVNKDEKLVELAVEHLFTDVMTEPNLKQFYVPKEVKVKNAESKLLASVGLLAMFDVNTHKIIKNFNKDLADKKAIVYTREINSKKVIQEAMFNIIKMRYEDLKDVYEILGINITKGDFKQNDFRKYLFEKFFPNLNDIEGEISDTSDLDSD